MAATTDFAYGAYQKAAPTLLDMLLSPVMPWIKGKAGEAATAGYEALIPELEKQAERTAKQTVVLMAVALGVGVTVWMVLRKKKGSRR